MKGHKTIAGREVAGRLLIAAEAGSEDWAARVVDKETARNAKEVEATLQLLHRTDPDIRNRVR